MKKLSKSALIITVVTALLFAVAATALAVSWGESGTFSGHAYSGDYYATMSLTDDKASARLEVSNYKGIIQVGGGAEIEGMLISDGYVTLSKTSTIGEDIYTAYLNIDSSNGFDPNKNYDEFLCLFTFYDFSVTNHIIYK